MLFLIYFNVRFTEVVPTVGGGEGRESLYLTSCTLTTMLLLIYFNVRFTEVVPTAGRERGEELISNQLHCHHQNDFRSRTGSDVSQLNVSLIMQGKVTRQRPSITFLEQKGEPKRGVGVESFHRLHSIQKL